VEFNTGYFSRLYRERLKALLDNCRSIVILGLAYTADAKMHKLSPAFDALECLRDTPRLRLHDPYYSLDDIEDLCGVATLTFPEDLGDCDGIVLVTPHSVYRDASVESIIRPGTVIVDNFGTWKHKRFLDGVRYHEVGRPWVEDSRTVLRHPEPSSTVAG
jgi:UDP-N-acetyl-D-mannosaminuronate dehydrogenase